MIQKARAIFFGESRTFVVLRAIIWIAAIAFLDWQLRKELPLGILYLLPMLMIGRSLRVVDIVFIAILCTTLSEIFDPFPWHGGLVGISRDLLYFIAYFCVGFVIHEVNRNRKIAARHLEEVNREQQARQEAEEQLKLLIETSPAAILTADASGSVIMANEAAHRMLLVANGELAGHPIYRYFPSLVNVARLASTRQLFRTVMQSRGQRDSGEMFLADICISTYRTENGSMLAALILDSSEELRTREEAGLQQVMSGSRIALGAVAHEIRNICGAIQAVQHNLARNPTLAHNKDFEALGSLIGGLGRIAAVDLHRNPDQASEIELASLIDDFKIVVGPSLAEQEVTAAWSIPTDLPPIWTERTTLIQVLLNLTRNSLRAMNDVAEKRLQVTAWSNADSVFIDFEDNGSGVAQPEQLFHPFQAGAQDSGLGLYLSRALLRAFGGDLQFQPSAAGAVFRVEVRAAFAQVPR